MHSRPFNRMHASRKNGKLDIELFASYTSRQTYPVKCSKSSRPTYNEWTFQKTSSQYIPTSSRKPYPNKCHLRYESIPYLSGFLLAGHITSNVLRSPSA